MKKLFLVLAMLLFVTSMASATPAVKVGDNISLLNNDAGYLTESTPGPQGEQGPAGESIIGPQGLQGANGIDSIGENGKDGANGKDADNRETPVGIGADVTVWQNKAKTVDLEAQYKYDINNEEHSIFGVVKINLWEILKKK